MRGRFMGMRRFFFFALPAVCGFLFMAACTDQDQKSRRKPVSAVSAQTYQVMDADMPEMMAFSGRTRAKVQVALASRVSGFVREVKVLEGEPVNKGDLILAIDDTDTKAGIQSLLAEKEGINSQKAAAMADFVYAKANFERYGRLKNEDAATQEEFDRAQARFEALKNQVSSLEAASRRIDARLEEARNQLSYVSLTSPVNGWVVEKTVDKGTYVNPGVTLVKIDARDSGFWFESDVDEALLAVTRPGDKIYLSIPSAGVNEVAKISQVVPYVNTSTHSFVVRIDMEQAGRQGPMPLKSGLYGRLFVLKGKTKCRVVPEKALVKRGGMTGLYTVGKDRIVHWRVVTTGRKWVYEKGEWMPCLDGAGQMVSQDVFVEVLSGVNSKETVVVSNLDMVQEGVRLE
ncbi:MAG: efflux RND transporter periplasmic adaptor subunit [Dissulfurimicrobium sp.]|uniref:efflux RND transporter periplasmic adaptor subunit n=1 Tax=Dissulfurimicrobium sp. TaxID=2022436 RepID=UPI004048EFF5